MNKYAAFQLLDVGEQVSYGWVLLPLNIPFEFIALGSKLFFRVPGRRVYREFQVSFRAIQSIEVHKTFTEAQSHIGPGQ